MTMNKMYKNYKNRKHGLISFVTQITIPENLTQIRMNTISEICAFINKIENTLKAKISSQMKICFVLNKISLTLYMFISFYMYKKYVAHKRYILEHSILIEMSCVRCKLFALSLTWIVMKIPLTRFKDVFFSMFQEKSVETFFFSNLTFLLRTLLHFKFVSKYISVATTENAESSLFKKALLKKYISTPIVKNSTI